MPYNCNNKGKKVANPANKGRGYIEPTSKEPEVLKALPLIPWWRVSLIVPKLSAPSDSQKKAIRKRLNMRDGQPFKKCKGQVKSRILKFEEQGDFSHSGHLQGTWGYQPAKKGEHKKPPPCGFCTECTCGHIAGEGTKGDFYGLGPETGHYGVGYCVWCQKGANMVPSTAVRIARAEVESMNRYGDVKDTTQALVEYEDEQKALAVARKREREEVMLLADEIEKVRKELESDEAFEYIKGERVPMSTKSRVRMLTDLARSRSRLRLDDIQLDDNSYVHVDEIASRMPDMRGVVFQSIDKLYELVVRWYDSLTVVCPKCGGTHRLGDAQTIEPDGEKSNLEVNGNFCEYVKEMFVRSWKEIWKSVKQGRR